MGRLAAEKIPYLMVAAAIGAITVTGMHARIETGVVDNPPFGQTRSLWANASYGIASPIINTFAPRNLSPCNVTPESFDLFNVGFTAAFVVCLALCAASMALARKLPAFGAAVTGYFLLAAPFLGAGAESTADRYTILSAMPFALLLGGVLLMLHRRGRGPRGIASTLIVLWICVLGFLSWNQTAIWKDSIVFCGQMLKTDPDSPLLHNSMGQLLCAEGKWEEAASHFRHALRQEQSAETHNNLGMALAPTGDRQGAIAHFQSALEISPDNQPARANLLKMGAPIPPGLSATSNEVNSNGD